MTKIYDEQVITQYVLGALPEEKTEILDKQSFVESQSQQGEPQ